MPISATNRRQLQRLGFDVARDGVRFTTILPERVAEREEAQDFLNDIIANGRNVIQPDYTFSNIQSNVVAENGRWRLSFNADIIESITIQEPVITPTAQIRSLRNPNFGLGVEHEMVLGGSDGNNWKIVSGHHLAGYRGWNNENESSRGLIGPRYVAEVIGSTDQEKDQIENEINSDIRSNGEYASRTNRNRLKKSGGITGYEQTDQVSATGVGFGGDYKLSEIKTTDYKNAKVEDIAADIVKKGKIVEKLANQRANNYGENARPVSRAKQHATDNKVVIVPFGAVEGDVGGIGAGRGYTGSYHVNIMLPYDRQTTEAENVANYKKFSQAFQWIEPLLLANYFSPDPKSMGDYGVRTEGSFRLISTTWGWGSLGGSNPSKLSAERGMYKYDAVYLTEEDGE